MKAIPLDHPDRRLGAPQNWNHETEGICYSLEIWDRDGFMISGWRPTANELAKLNAGEPLWLHIQGQAHPVVAMTVGYEANPTRPSGEA